jgi:integrase
MAKNTTDTTTVRVPRGMTITKSPRGWVKKIGGRVVWLAPLDNPQLARQRAAEHLHAYMSGRQVVGPSNQHTLAQLASEFIDDCLARVEAPTPTLDRLTYSYYYAVMEHVCTHFRGRVALDITPADWQGYRNALATMGVARQRNYVVYVKRLSNWALSLELIDRPLRFGKEFKAPSPKADRVNRAKRGDRTISPADLYLLLLEASPQLRAAILLACNTGIGNTDLAKLCVRDIDRHTATLTTYREKTGIHWVAPLWPETIAALAPLLARKAPGSLVFTTKGGRPLLTFATDDPRNASRNDCLARNFGRLRNRLGLTCTYYDCRRTFSTVAQATGDFPSVMSIMGHSFKSDDMLAQYRQRIAPENLLNVVNHVRRQLLLQPVTAYR